MATTETFLECAAPLILRKGMRGTGLNEILGATGLTKGAFYYHFKDKNDFGKHYIQYAGQNILESLESFLAAKDEDPSRRLLNFFESRALRFERDGFAGGCPLGNLSQELPDILPELREVLEAEFNAITGAMDSTLEECREEGSLRLNDAAGVLSAELMFSWQGALMYAKLFKRFDALDTFLSFHFGPSGWFEDQPYDKSRA